MQAILNNKKYELYVIRENSKIILKGIEKNNKTIILNKKEI